MEQQKMINVPIPYCGFGEFIVPPVHAEDRSFLLTTEQARELRDNLTARLKEAE